MSIGKILLVDDEKHILKALKRSLMFEPYEIITASSGQEAMQILETTSVDVVISDEMMPGMNGSEFLNRVCNKYPDTIRILLTGFPSVEVLDRAVKRGEIYSFLAKPWNDDDLIDMLHEVIHKKNLESSKENLQKTKETFAALQELEEEAPGISKIERDEDGAIIIDDEDDLDDIDSYLDTLKER